MLKPERRRIGAAVSVGVEQNHRGGTFLCALLPCRDLSCELVDNVLWRASCTVLDTTLNGSSWTLNQPLKRSIDSSMDSYRAGPDGVSVKADVQYSIFESTRRLSIVPPRKC